MSRRANYDALAATYDSGWYRGKSFDKRLTEFLRERYAAPSPVILDIACGTGAQLAANAAERPDIQSVGIDLSIGMLRQAQRRRPDLTWIRADASGLPFADASFDYISNQFAFHHFTRQEEFLREAVRVLRPKGRLTIRKLDARHMTGWVLYRYFPAALERDLNDSPPMEHVADILRGCGCTVDVHRRQLNGEISFRDLVEDFSARDARSQLTAIRDGDYEAGLRRVRKDCERLGPDAVIASEKCDVTVVATKG